MYCSICPLLFALVKSYRSSTNFWALGIQFQKIVFLKRAPQFCLKLRRKSRKSHHAESWHLTHAHVFMKDVLQPSNRLPDNLTSAGTTEQKNLTRSIDVAFSRACFIVLSTHFWCLSRWMHIFQIWFPLCLYCGFLVQLCKEKETKLNLSSSKLCKGWCTGCVGSHSHLDRRRWFIHMNKEVTIIYFRSPAIHRRRPMPPSCSPSASPSQNNNTWLRESYSQKRGSEMVLLLFGKLSNKIRTFYY